MTPLTQRVLLSQFAGIAGVYLGLAWSVFIEANDDIATMMIVGSCLAVMAVTFCLLSAEESRRKP